jgi:hypothetical protein
MNHQFDELKIALLSATEVHYSRLHSNENIPVRIDDPLHNYCRYGPQEWLIWDDLGLFGEVNRIIASIQGVSGFLCVRRLVESD